MNPLLHRDINAFPLSIGTSLALESLFNGKLPTHDPEREIPNKIILDNYNACYINLFTLLRNMSGSVNKETKQQINENDYAEILEQEIDIIQNLFRIEGSDLIKPVFYKMEYRRAETKAKSKLVDLREEITIQQKHDKVMFFKTLEKLKNESYFNKYTDHIHGGSGVRALIITHQPYDLLSHDKVSRLDLLESHTGKLKTKHNWSSKYQPFGDRSMRHLPFLEKLLLIFGDKVLIKPMLLKIRQQVYDISIKRGWSPMTTKSKIEMDIASDIEEIMISGMLRQL